MDPLARARQAASRYLTERGYPGEARLVDQGQGDDFAEVRIALHLLAQADERTTRYERVLGHYADPAFWDDDPPGSGLAADDQGRMARNALAGRDEIVQHFD